MSRPQPNVLLVTSDQLVPFATALRDAVLERFDPDAIAADGAASVRRRELVRRALERDGTSWDDPPVFGATRRCVR